MRQSWVPPLQDVYGAFTPWQHLSTSVPELDSLLSVAGVCGGVSGGDGGSDVESAIGGLPVSGLHEFYGPPLSGKSWILRRVGAAYVRRMTGYRQWYHDHVERASAWAVKATPRTRADGDEAQTTKDDDELIRKEVMANVWPHSGNASPATAVEEWDLYVCLVSGAGAGDATLQPTATPPSSDMQRWMEVLSAPFDFSSTHDGQKEAGAVDPSHRRQWQQQRDYAEQHIHFRVAHSPNELLTFLEHLGNDAESSSVPPATLIASQQQSLSVQLCQGSTTTTARRQKRCHSPDTAQHSPQSYPFSSSNFPQRTWRLQRQRLLLLDGLDSLWMHPSLGNHSATHTGQWFAEELHRQLRRVLSPRLGFTTSNNALPAVSFCTTAASSTPPHPQHTLYSTVVLTNGCHGSSRGVVTAPQLEARLGSPGGGGGAVGGWSAMLPRPSGSAVWCRAADTRCLVEPAHPGLVSIPTSSSSVVQPVKVSPGPGDVHHERHGITSTFGQSITSPLESLVTVVKGGSRVAATWILHEVSDSEYKP
ncbi:hypothetical protein JKF63_02160 [Porcisia hertigi]|uniref:Uncharacterized protein n=1 Tax=Porcisia hertigi TaxID=2761500 RepID=A0A836HYZ8_9TRYP|nr:hypothetical protein JKF63_02160 [Porcisia hertigi]